jgi:hypothetical protein
LGRVQRPAAFLKSSTPDSEIPSDHAITAILFQTVLKERVKYILIGTNVATDQRLSGSAV